MKRLSIDLTLAAAIAALESFPAWNHSAEIGTYLLCGAAVIALASFRAARRSQLAEA